MIRKRVNIIKKEIKNKREKGITLVALVITVILLLILAGVTIGGVLGEKGLAEEAKNATKKYGEAQDEEKNVVKNFLDELRNINSGGDGTGGNPNNPGDNTTAPGNPPEQDKPTEPVIEDKSGANSPNIKNFAQKTYVTWDLNEAETEYVLNDTQTTQPDNWYNYENGKWANIKTTNKVSDTETLEAYWVWIPRYEYIVPTSTTATEIQVRFIGTDKKEGTEGYTKQTDGTIKSSDGYTIHPAFTNEGNGGFGELDGIWVGKFEASSNTITPDTNYGGGDDPKLKVQIKPGVQSWRNIGPNNIFTVCRKMTESGEVLAGESVDTHMMKNMEWGAVAILSQSKYGIFNPQSSLEEPTDGTKRRIWNNSNGYNSYKNIYTGYAGNMPDASIPYHSSTAPRNVYEYNTINGTKASTTGTVYGVYDMAGGSWEYVAGCLNGQENAKLGVTIGDTKYVDLYINKVNSDLNYNGAKIGDATKETKTWNGDYSLFVYSSSPIFVRGRWLLLWHRCR